MENYDSENVMRPDDTESIWKIDGPIGRLDFFWIIVISQLILLPAYFFSKMIGITGSLVFFFFALLIILPAWWVTFAATAKRFYDITGSKKTGIIIAVCEVLASLILFKYASVAITLLGFFMNGKYVSTGKVEEVEERKEMF